MSIKSIQQFLLIKTDKGLPVVQTSLMDPRNTLRPDTPLPVNPQSKNKQKSPQTNELLIASRKGYASEVKRILAEGGGSVAESIQDKVSILTLSTAAQY